MAGLLWAVIVILAVLWILGLVAFHITSAFIHLLLVVAVILVLYNLFANRRAV